MLMLWQINTYEVDLILEMENIIEIFQENDVGDLEDFMGQKYSTKSELKNKE